MAGQRCVALMHVRVCRLLLTQPPSVRKLGSIQENAFLDFANLELAPACSQNRETEDVGGHSTVTQREGQRRQCPGTARGNTQCHAALRCNRFRQAT